MLSLFSVYLYKKWFEIELIACRQERKKMKMAAKQLY